VLEPFIGLGDGLALGIAQRLPIFFGRDHGFEQMNHGGELARSELIEQMMGVLPVSGHYVPPQHRSCAKPSPSETSAPELIAACIHS